MNRLSLPATATTTATALLVWTAVSLPAPLEAQSPGEPSTTAEELDAGLPYETGTIHLKGGMATIHLPASFRFLGAEGSRRLLTDGWGNPASASDDVLGMLVPAGLSPMAAEGWGIVITYEEDGYVDDDDAGQIDYDQLLRQMQESTSGANEERRKQGFEPVTLIGWAEPPSYDLEAHKLYWAKELAFGDSASNEHTLNYNIRVLGRRGVLVLNAVASMSQLSSIRTEARGILPAVDFNEGHRYTDYLPGQDKAAAYGITGLIVGAAAAKAGFFKVLFAGILAFKKLIVVGFLALVAAVKRMFGAGAGSRESAG